MSSELICFTFLAAFMEPDDLATSEKLEQHRQRRAAPTEEDDEATLEEVDGELESAEARFTRNRRQLPYIIYPEVLVIIDYDGYRLHGGDNLQVSLKLETLKYSFIQIPFHNYIHQYQTSFIENICKKT